MSLGRKNRVPVPVSAVVAWLLNGLDLVLANRAHY
jgi:hypothetical protein